MLVILTPVARPEHTVYEGLVPVPLLCNPMLPILAKAITKNAIRDYRTIDELLGIEPPDEEMYPFHLNESVLDIPFFQDPAGKMQKATAFGNRLKALGLCAGYPRPPTIHDFRAEGLVLTGTCTTFPPSFTLPPYQSDAGIKISCIRPLKG